MARWRVAGINFTHFHMGDNLRMAARHEDVEVVAVCHERREPMQAAIDELGIPEDRVFEDWQACLETAQPNVILTCPAASKHAEWVERLAPSGAHLLVEKPMAASVPEARRMLRAIDSGGGRLAINWPMAWYATNRTAYRLVREGRIGAVREVHYYDGNRGPLWHTAGRRERTAAEVDREKPTSWFYSAAAGGGSLLDYLGYGTTLATWFNGGQMPSEVIAMADRPQGLEVDEHAIAVARYATGLSKFETRWGTFTDPWTHQPQPKCGFVIVGEAGTLSSFDFEPIVRLQTQDSPAADAVPVDRIAPPYQDPVQYFLHCLENDLPVEGPLDPAVSLVGQSIVDAAVESVRRGAAVKLEPIAEELISAARRA